MNKILLIISLILSLLACEKTNTEISELVAVDSLGWDEDSDDVFSHGSSFNLYKDEIFVASDSQIKVFSKDSFRRLRQFGSVGSAPVEFKGIFGTCVLNDTLFVSDIANFRMQKLTLEGEYISMVKKLGGQLYNHQGKIYGYTPFYLRPFVYEYVNNSFQELYDVNDYFSNAHVVLFFAMFSDNHIFITGEDKKLQMYKITKENKAEKMEISATLQEKGYDEIRSFYATENFLYLTTSKANKTIDYKYQSSSSFDFNNKFESQEFLVTINSNFEIIKEERLPKRITTWRSIHVDKDYVYLMDAPSHVLYKLKREK